MLNIDDVETVYIACGSTDLRKSIDGLVMIVKNQLKLNPFGKSLFVLCNKQMDKLKILHFDEDFWLYYYRLEGNRFKWPATDKEAIGANIEELRTTSKFKPIKEGNYFKKFSIKTLESLNLICSLLGRQLK